MKKRKHIFQDGPGLVLPDGGFRSIGTNNLRRWTTMENGATRVSEWNGEEDVVLLGYSAPGDSEAQIKMAQFTTASSLGPTASAANCSPIRMQSKPAQPPLSDAFYWDDNGVWQNVLATQNDFDDGAGAYPAGTFLTGDNNPKPSLVQIVIGLWLEHDNVYNPPHATRRGVFETGIGGGDIIYLENLSTGAETWFFTGMNEFRNDGLDIPQSLDWSGTDTEGSNPGARHKVCWLDFNANRTDTWRISVRHPGWGQNPFSTAAFSYPPDPMRYHCQVYVVEGCSILGNVAIDGDMIGTPADPIHDRASSVITGASVGSVSM
jgi:hypothetical protein